jgi:hypothetical protein
MRTHRSFFIAAALLIPAAVLAANAHFLSGPTLTVRNNALEVCGSIAGLGNQNVTIRVSGTADVQCVNKGGNPPPGQRQTVTGQVSNLRVENGRVNFCVTTARLTNNCPDGMRISATFLTATITVIQGGRVVLQQTLDV